MSVSTEGRTALLDWTSEGAGVGGGEFPEARRILDTSIHVFIPTHVMCVWSGAHGCCFAVR